MHARDDEILQYKLALRQSKESKSELTSYKKEFSLFVRSRDNDFKKDIKRLEQEVFMLEHGQVDEDNDALRNAHLECASLSSEVAALRAQTLQMTIEASESRQVTSQALPSFAREDIRHPTLHKAKASGYEASGGGGFGPSHTGGMVAGDCRT